MGKTNFFIGVITAVTYFVAVSACSFALGGAVTVAQTTSPFRIVIDAGHGGMDGGVSGISTRVKESDLNLQLAFLFGDRLKENGWEVSYTRTTESGLYGDTSPGFKKRDMLKRKEIICDASPSIVLSVHQNFFGSRYERGGVVFWKKGDEDSRRLGTLLQNSVNALYQTQGVASRVEKEGDLYILTSSPCVAVLLECGFLSSPLDEKLLLDGAFQDGLVSAVTIALTTFLVGEETA